MVVTFLYKSPTPLAYQGSKLTFQRKKPEYKTQLNKARRIRTITAQTLDSLSRKCLTKAISF